MRLRVVWGPLCRTRANHGGGRLLAFIRHSPPPVEVGRRPRGGGGGGGIGGGGSGRGNGGGGGWEGWLGGGGVQVGRFGVVRGGGGQAPPQSNHTITINLTLTFAASWFGHASHVNWGAQDPPNFVHGCFCDIIALHFGPQHSF